MSTNNSSIVLDSWNSSQELAENAIPLLGRLYRENTCIITLCDKPMQNISVNQIHMEHAFASQYLGTKISLQDTYPILNAIYHLRDSLNSTRLDLGRLSQTWKQKHPDEMQSASDAPNEDVVQFLREELKSFLSSQPAAEGTTTAPSHKISHEPKHIVLYGFGRIGRLIARILIEKTGGGDKMLLKAIVVRSKKIANDLDKRATLLARDSVHGPFEGVIEVNHEKKQLIVNGNVIQMIYANHPSEVDYTQYGIKDAIVVDNTGVWRDRAGLEQHLKAKGASQVLLTAPGKGIPNIVAGINYHEIDTEKEHIYSAASCTTNAIVPVLKVLHDRFNINHCHCETIHSFTNDQNLIDGMHPKARRGRSAPMNMVLTNTGAASAVALALPDLAGKITGSAVRVPTPNVSLAILMMNVASNTTKDEVNDYLHNLSLDSRQIGYDCSGEAVSTDIVGDRHAGVVDAPSTVVTKLSKEGDKPMSSINLYVFYDNESGYSAQCVRILQHMCPPVSRLRRY